jgi:hypothetical protein
MRLFVPQRIRWISAHTVPGNGTTRSAPRRDRDTIVTMLRLVSGLSVLGISLLVLTGCGVGQSVDSLHTMPEARFEYPGSTGVSTNDSYGTPGGWMGKGGIDNTGKFGKTTHSELEVLSYFSHMLAAKGWEQSGEKEKVELPLPAPSRVLWWEKKSLHLAYLVEVNTIDHVTWYETLLQSYQ